MTTIAGGNGEGYADGPGLSAKFNGPKGITVGSEGELYVIDRFNGIRMITTDGYVSTLVGGGTLSGRVDGDELTSRFLFLEQIVYVSGVLYVTESSIGSIRKIIIGGSELQSTTTVIEELTATIDAAIIDVIQETTIEPQRPMTTDVEPSQAFSMPSDETSTSVIPTPTETAQTGSQSGDLGV